MASSTVVTGGANGADACWAEAVRCRPDLYACEVMSFKGHQRAPCPGARVKELSRDELALSPVPRRGTGEYVTHLLARNWYVVKDAEALFLVGTIKGGRVDGGTGHAFSLFVQHKGPGAKVWAFDLAKKQWFRWRVSGAWVPQQPDPPHTFTRWAGVGSRSISREGREAIFRLVSGGGEE